MVTNAIEYRYTKTQKLSSIFGFLNTFPTPAVSESDGVE